MTVSRCEHGIQRVGPGDTRYCDACAEASGYVGRFGPLGEGAAACACPETYLGEGHADVCPCRPGPREEALLCDRALHGHCGCRARCGDDPALEPWRAYAGDAGTKDDGGKPRVDLLPFGALTEVAHVMTFGAQKYAAYNWHGLSCSRLFAAALRHLWAWWRGEDNDPETGQSHVAHAACCVLMVLDQVRERPQYDDRPRPIDPETGDRAPRSSRAT